MWLRPNGQHLTPRRHILACAFAVCDDFGEVEGIGPMGAAMDIDVRSATDNDTDAYPDIACESGLSLQSEKQPFDWDFRSRTALPRYARDDLLECKFWSGLNRGSPAAVERRESTGQFAKNRLQARSQIMKVLAEHLAGKSIAFSSQAIRLGHGNSNRDATCEYE